MALSWKTRSFRFWLTFGLALAVLPLALAAILGHVLLNHGVIGAFADVAARQRFQLAPTYRLRGILQDVVDPVDEFVDSGDPLQPGLYRAEREKIEAAFADLHKHFDHDPEPQALLDRARADWTSGDAIATDILSVRRAPGDAKDLRLMERFHGAIDSSVDKLGAIATDLDADLAGDHDEAIRFYERADWIFGIAAAVSLLAMLAAVVLIGRILSASVDRLVAGAERFAAGDREHRIDVQVPPELHSVAQEFNRMIVRIHESEAALADLARRDGLTKLPNRRAFDDALREQFARMDRLSERSALLMIDVDHFKRINDTHGHGVGDDVLRAVAQTMTADGRLADRVFRVGGEEFAVLLTGADAASAAATAERLRQAIAATRVPIAGGELAVTISVGLAAAEPGSSPASLTAAADAALYRAKQAGRNQVATAE